MGEKLPRVTADEIIRVLKKAGFVKVNHTGSHQKWYNFETGKQTIVADHHGDIFVRRHFNRF